MNKHTLSIAVLILAAAIIVVNIWEPFKTKTSEKDDTSSTNKVETASTQEEIPGVDLRVRSNVEEGNTAPDFKLTTLKGDQINLSDYRGKKVILNFWATWCPPCKAEMPHMQKFYENNKENGIEVVAVNLTNIDKGQKNIEAFVNDYGLTFDIPLDVDGDVGTEYQAFTIPTSYIIDSNGIITKRIVGPMDESMMTNLVSEIE
ncbi:peroxiredoxin family protein [Metabacillus halosaccharovorans]|uniref:peroxiredoxin family protein n=1 Tax=Metabacillus halosaccharovorans TaxID=930124 RepID=UPI003734F9BE